MYAYQIFPMKSVSIYSIWLKILDCKFGCKSLHFWEIPSVYIGKMPYFLSKLVHDTKELNLKNLHFGTCICKCTPKYANIS